MVPFEMVHPACLAGKEHSNGRNPARPNINARSSVTLPDPTQRKDRYLSRSLASFPKRLQPHAFRDLDPIHPLAKYRPEQHSRRPASASLTNVCQRMARHTHERLWFQCPNLSNRQLPLLTRQVHAVCPNRDRHVQPLRHQHLRR